METGVTALFLGHCSGETPEFIGNRAETSLFTLVRNYQLLRYDFNNGKNVGRWFLILYMNK